MKGAYEVKKKDRRYGTETKNEMKIAYPQQMEQGTTKWIACVTYNTDGDKWISFQKQDGKIYIY